MAEEPEPGERDADPHRAGLDPRPSRGRHAGVDRGHRGDRQGGSDPAWRRVGGPGFLAFLDGRYAEACSIFRATRPRTTSAPWRRRPRAWPSGPATRDRRRRAGSHRRQLVERRDGAPPEGRRSGRVSPRSRATPRRRWRCTARPVAAGASSASRGRRASTGWTWRSCSIPTIPAVRAAADRSRELYTKMGAVPLLELLDAAMSRPGGTRTQTRRPRHVPRGGRARLTPVPRRAAAYDPPVDLPEAATTSERRIVSVLFADLVGFTTLAEGLDPEDLATIQDAYFATVRDDRRALPRLAREVHRRRGDGRVRHAPRRGRRRAPRRPGGARADPRDRGPRRAAGARDAGAAAAGRRQHGRGARRDRRPRRGPGERRHRQRRGPAPDGRGSGRHPRRRADGPLGRARGRARAGRAAGAEGQGQAGPGVARRGAPPGAVARARDGSPAGADAGA